MKINIVFGHSIPFPPIKGGGIERIDHSLAKAIIHAGHEVTAYSRSYHSLPNENTDEFGINHIRIRGYDYNRSKVINAVNSFRWCVKIAFTIKAADVTIFNSPFAFIMILLWKARDIAKDFSGKIGSMVTNAATAAGGAALGLGAAGVAMAGRNTVGAVSKYAQNDGARSNALRFQDTQNAVAKIKGWNAINPFAYAKVATTAIQGVGKAAAAGVGAGVNSIKTTVDDGHGGTKRVSWYKETSSKLKDKNHSIHALDEKAQAIMHDKTAKYSDLDETDKQKVKDAINRDVISKGMNFNKNYDRLNYGEKRRVDGEITRLGGNLETVAHAKGLPGSHSGEDMDGLSKANVSVSEFVNALRKGSYDVRNMSKMTTQSKGLPSLLVDTSSFVGARMREGFKGITGTEINTGQKDFMKDLKNSISDALKGIKFDIKIDNKGSSHEKDKHDDHGGGGHH